MRLLPMATPPHTRLMTPAACFHHLNSEVPGSHRVKHAAFTVQSPSQLHQAYLASEICTRPAKACTVDHQAHSIARSVPSNLDLMHHLFILSQTKVCMVDLRVHSKTSPVLSNLHSTHLLSQASSRSLKSGPTIPHDHTAEHYPLNHPTNSSNQPLKQ